MGEDISKRKPFLTYDQQIEKLVEKGLVINDIDYVKKLLKECSYFSLISGYKKPFKSKTDLYKKNTCINDIYALYKFDSDLRSIILKGTLLVENHVKSLISYSFCETNGYMHNEYLDATNYKYIPENQNGINKLIGKFLYIIDNPRNYPYITYQKGHYNNIPLWAMLKALPLGSVSKN